MDLPPPLVDESARLAALHALDVLDSPPEPEFDALVRAAAALCGTPIALISLIDADRQWFKARCGLDSPQTPRDVSFCSHALGSSALMEVADARRDPRFYDHPSVLGSPHVRFYAGAPLVLSSGHRIGTLCVIDTAPRVLDDRQRRALGDLATVVVAALERRRDALAVRPRLPQPVAGGTAPTELAGLDTDARFRALLDVAPVGVFVTDASGRCLSTNRRWQQIFGLGAEEALGDGWAAALHLDDAADVLADWQRQASRRASFDREFRIEPRGSGVRVVRTRATPVLAADGALNGYIGTVEDISERRLQVDALLDILRSQFIVSITDTSGRIVEVNAAFEAISGYAAAELIGADHRIINSGTHPKAFFQGLWRALAQGQVWRGEVCNRRKDGRLYWVDSVIAPLRDADGRVHRFVSMRRDITRKKEQEERLRVSELLLNRTGEVAGVGGWQLDLRSETLEWTTQTRRIHNVPDDFVPALESAIHFYAPESRPHIERAVRRAVDEGEGWDLELALVRQGGERIWVRAVGEAEREEGVTVRLWGAFQDITADVERRQALEHAQRTLALATESASIGLWELDLDSGVVAWDATLRRLHGFGPRTPMPDAEGWLALVLPEDRDAARAAIRAALGRAQSGHVDARVRWHDGTVRHLRGSIRALPSGRRLVGVAWDVTEERRLADTAQAERERLDVTLRSIADAVITTDAQARVTWMNPVAERMTQWARADAHGRPIAQVFHRVAEAGGEPPPGSVALALKPGGPAAGVRQEGAMVSRGGAEYAIAESAAPIHGADGRVVGAVLVFHDITEQRRQSREMQHRATHDALTGLVNRGEFDLRLTRALERALEADVESVLVAIDLDAFKPVNDACGHAAGDLVLQQVAAELGRVVRSRDTLARIGGDEFAVILERCRPEQAARVAEAIRAAMAGYRFVHGGRTFDVSASIGVAPIDRRFSRADAVLAAADAACRTAKLAGPGRVQFWVDDDVQVGARSSELDWSRRLRDALSNDHFSLYVQRLQPLWHEGEELRVEVLAHLRDGGIDLPPQAFLPAAERHRLAQAVDRCVLAEVLRRMAPGQALESAALVGVNVSAQAIGDRDFHAHVDATLAAAGIARVARLCFEIPEAVAVAQLADTHAFIDILRRRGALAAVDNAGFAPSFAYLKSLRFDLLKLDGRLVRGVADDPVDAAAVRHMVELALATGAQTVAKDVEHPACLKRIRELGVDFAQGFLRHRPEPIDRLAARA